MNGSQPDIVFILSDEHGPHISSVYGNSQMPMPSLDRLAREGMVFDAAYCASPICVPSRMAFMTGRHCSRIGVYDNGSPLRSDIPTLAHTLRLQGYETVLIGKMHFIGPDQMHGFDRRPVGDEKVCGHTIEAPDWEAGDPTPAVMRSRIDTAAPGTTDHIEQDENVLAAALAELDRLAAAGADRKPVFLCISFNTPHFPLVVPAAYYVRFQGKVAPRLVGPGGAGEHPYHRRIRRYFDVESLSDEEVERARTAYFGLVAHLDDLIGHVLGRLDRHRDSGFEPLVCYASDHGEMAGEHGLWWKCSFYEESARVPLLVRWPGVVPAASRSAVPVSLLDLSATFAALAGATPENSLFMAETDGKILLPVLTGDGMDEGRAVIAEYLAHAASTPIRMVRRGHWKYVYYHGESEELYRLDIDPHEQHNLADAKEHAATKAGLRATALRNWEPEALAAAIRSSQRERHVISAAMRR
jgi:choline-sulfatase